MKGSDWTHIPAVINEIIKDGEFLDELYELMTKLAKDYKEDQNQHIIAHKRLTQLITFNAGQDKPIFKKYREIGDFLLKLDPILTNKVLSLVIRTTNLEKEGEISECLEYLLKIVK